MKMQVLHALTTVLTHIGDHTVARFSHAQIAAQLCNCLLYTSDAADEL